MKLNSAFVALLGLSVVFVKVASQPGPGGQAGPPGRAGRAGSMGPAGPMGSRGEQGEQGEPGRAGRAGSMGPAGPMGQRGEQGEQGARGLAGTAGSMGPAGPMGQRGEQGSRGSQGRAGEAGVAGPQGQRGMAGPQGPSGEPGERGQPGETGRRGEPGPQGPSGEPGPRGPRGETGEPGQPGQPGRRGAPGPQAGHSGRGCSRRTTKSEPGQTQAVPGEPTYPRTVVRTLTVTNGDRYGRWGRADFCPYSTYARGFELKVDQSRTGDSTALNGIALKCESRHNDYYQGDVRSTVGQWGAWSAMVDCIKVGNHKFFLSAFQLRVAPDFDHNSCGYTAANNIKFKCRPFACSIDYEVSGSGLTWGSYGSWSRSCPSGSAICGIQTKVEDRQGDEASEDDTALNDVRFFCCSLE